jgi:hypothetical protein
MSARRRRSRRADPLASVAVIRRVLDRVSGRLPGHVSWSHRDLVRALRAASHCERSGWVSSHRGRKPNFDRDTLRAAWNALSDVLAREMDSAVSPRTFTEHYIRLLSCPHDVLEPLADARINLFEALQLARIHAKATGMTPAGATRLRGRILSSHITSQASARQLYERVNALLDPDAGSSAKAHTSRPGDFDEGSEIDDEVEAYTADPGALFADQLRQIALALSQIDADAITEAETGAILDLLDQLYLKATKAAKRSQS